VNKLLLLHNRYTPDDADIWRVAVRAGWHTQRTNALQVADHVKGYDMVRYYGNTLHASQLPSEALPFKFTDIDYSYLARLTQFTRRPIDYIRFETLGQPLKQDAFIKPARDKWFEARVYKAGETITGSPMGGDEIYVSGIVKFVDEVRCFVLDGEIQTSSLYRINGQVWDLTGLPPDMINFDKQLPNTPLSEYVREICKIHTLPKGVVIDFGRLPNGDWVLIEFNEAWASGLYYCDPHKCLNVIIESQTQ
jgi:hypothetical protein